MVTIRCRFNWKELWTLAWYISIVFWRSLAALVAETGEEYIKWKTAQIILTIQSLSYNDHMSFNYAIDCLLEPVFWFVDNFAGYLGRVFVFSVTILTTAVVGIAYWIGLPYWWHRNPYFTVFLVIFGNWLLLNIVFHYYMGVSTPPGYPSHGAILIEAASICKKCISPKPPRTHHCSVCDRCVLAMDHHCPWLNNCVGYYNARYFYLYMVYMVAGICFLIIFGIDIGYQVLWVYDGDSLPIKDEPDLFGHPLKLNKSGVLVPVKDIPEYDSINFPREHILPTPEITQLDLISADPWKRKAIIFMAITCLSVLLALGSLVTMHGKHISRGETSVESHINAAMERRSSTFRNPYNFGRRKNWKIFLGLTQGRTFLHVLFPSRHAPTGNGRTWHMINNGIEDWP